MGKKFLQAASNEKKIHAALQVFVEWRQKKVKLPSSRTFYTDMNVIQKIKKKIMSIKLL